MVHCKKSWVWTVRQFVIPWLCSHWRTTFWVSSDGRRSEDTSSRVRCLPVEDKLKTSRLFLNQTWSDLVKSRSANRFFRLLQLQYSMRLSKSYHIVLSQGLTPVWVFPPAGQHVAASRQRSARVPLRDRLGPHESSHLVSWEEEKGKERLRFSQHCESKHVNIDQHVQVYILVMHLQEVKPLCKQWIFLTRTPLSGVHFFIRQTLRLLETKLNWFLDWALGNGKSPTYQFLKNNSHNRCRGSSPSF